MGTTNKENIHAENVTYQVENRQFLVSRRFGASKTISQLLTEEISNGALQNMKLNSQTVHDIMEP